MRLCASFSLPAIVAAAVHSAGPISDEPRRAQQMAGQRNGNTRHVLGTAEDVITNTDAIYLPDLPDRDLFAARDRALTAGYIGPEEHERLQGNEDPPTFVRLSIPMPVYFIDITAAATEVGPLLFSDPCQREN